MRFAIITPTIGRPHLERCIITLKDQVYKEFVHIVVGDGPQDYWVGYRARTWGCHYAETPKKEGFYGTAPRNMALDLIESGKLGDFDYVLYCDDDNVLLEPLLYNLVHGPLKERRPGIVWWDVLFTNKYMTKYDLLPKSGHPLIQGDWDSLSAAYRADVVRGLRWDAVYRHDWLYGTMARDCAKGDIVRWDGIGGVHFLSWDTFEPEKKE